MHISYVLGSGCGKTTIELEVNDADNIFTMSYYNNWMGDNKKTYLTIEGIMVKQSTDDTIYDLRVHSMSDNETKELRNMENGIMFATVTFLHSPGLLDKEDLEYEGIAMGYDVVYNKRDLAYDTIVDINFKTIDTEIPAALSRVYKSYKDV